MIEKQSGFTLVILLTVLSALGGLALAQMSSGIRPQITLSNALALNTTLNQSRQALISYSAHYPYLYGPKGAGVGHLPCPDTDLLHDELAQWSTRQGPNPPCGKKSVATGHVPSHISFAQSRYMIHAGLGLRADYEVSAKVVNNPGRQQVNPSLLNNSPESLSHIAVLQQSLSLSNSSERHTSTVMVTKKALMLVVRSSVAAWLIQFTNSQGSSACVVQHEVLARDDEYELEERCDQIKQLITLCHTQKAQSSSATDASPRTSWESTANRLQTELILLYLADEIPRQFDCKRNAVEQVLFEQVPASRHWFIRNGWLDWLRFEFDDQCIRFPLVACRLSHVNINALEQLDEPLTLRWVSEQ